MKKTLLFVCIICIPAVTIFAQLCPGGGLSFINAVAFNQSWVTNCPGSGITHDNQVGCEPTTAMDACAPAASCAVGTTGSDIWYFFYAGATTATIVINPSSSFDAGLQVFLGSACPGLTQLACVDAGGNNQPETINLSGLTLGARYLFRVYGATNSAPNRTGTYTFCGTSSNLLQFELPVVLEKFEATAQKSTVQLQWSTVSEINTDHFELERSRDNGQYIAIATVNARGSLGSLTQYTWRDLTPDPGMNYYRLKIIDVNGNYSYSPTISVKVNFIKQVTILENPVSDVLIIIARKPVAIRILNTAGELFRTVNLKKGRNEIPVSSLPAGIYYVMGNDQINEKILIR